MQQAETVVISTQIKGFTLKKWARNRNYRKQNGRLRLIDIIVDRVQPKADSQSVALSNHEKYIVHLCQALPMTLAACLQVDQVLFAFFTAFRPRKYYNIDVIHPPPK